MVVTGERRRGGGGATRLDLRFDNLRPEHLAEQLDQMQWLRLFDAPLDGNLGATVYADGRIEGLTGRISAGAGRILALQEQGQPFESIELAFAYEAGRERMQVSELAIVSQALDARLAVLMGGRIAEEMTFNQITTGAQNDFEQATEVARKMVCEWGMSESLGPLTYGKKEEAIFLGKEFNRHQDYSEDTALKIDAEIKRVVTEQYVRATRLLNENKEAPGRVAGGLLQRGFGHRRSGAGSDRADAGLEPPSSRARDAERRG